MSDAGMKWRWKRYLKERVAEAREANDPDAYVRTRNIGSDGDADE